MHFFSAIVMLVLLQSGEASAAAKQHLSTSIGFLSELLTTHLQHFLCNHVSSVDIPNRRKTISVESQLQSKRLRMSNDVLPEKDLLGQVKLLCPERLP